MDLDSLCKLFKSLSFSELISCKSALGEILKEKTVESLSMSPKDFVDFTPDFLQKDSVLYQAILSEVSSAGVKSPNNKTATTWLTTTGRHYEWSTANGHVTKKDPVDMSKYPAIMQLMQDINTRFGCKLNSCLLSHYKCGVSSTRYHSDDESSLDHTQGLYVVSLGAGRIIDVLPAAGDKRYNSDFTVNATDCSLYVMKPGCQKNFVHKVRSDRSVREERFSLSFRCMLPAADSDHAVTVPTANETAGVTTEVKPSDSTTPIYYRHSPRQPKKRKTTVLFGTSITKYIRSKQLGFRGRKVINMSQSGAKIKDVKENVRIFYETNEAALSDDIEKVIFSLGTNDIKYSKFGVQHLKKHIDELIYYTKSLFPAAVVIFQCCLPIRCMYPYIARNVLEFNSILRDLCLLNNCVYIDCFRDFLNFDLKFCNKELYHDWLHLNNRGVGVLSNWLKYVVNENSFDRVVNNLVGL